jgi:AcrR family transcriptional regulator
MLAAALSLISRQGYQQTSTAQVAREASTSESQLIKHFGSKDGLLEALFDAVWADLNDRIKELASAERDPIRRLQAIVALMLARIAANEEVRRLMLFEGRRNRSRGVGVSTGFILFVTRLDQLLTEAKHAGRLRVPLAPPAIRSLLIGACEGLLRDRQLAADASFPAPFSQKDIQRAIEALIGAFFIDPPLPPARRQLSSPSHRRRRKAQRR